MSDVEQAAAGLASAMAEDSIGKAARDAADAILGCKERELIEDAIRDLMRYAYELGLSNGRMIGGGS